MPAAVSSETASGGGAAAWRKSHRFAANEPSQMPGQTRRPWSSIAASARPDGGQTGVTWPPGIANCSPSRAVRK